MMVACEEMVGLSNITKKNWTDLLLMNSELLLDHGLDIWQRMQLMKGKPSVNSHPSLYIRVLRVLLGVMSLLNGSLVVIFI